MLERLYIENVAVIERAEIEFYEGFNILTGETGAGKSIIIDSLGMLLGQRASKDLVRTGCSYAYVAGRFALSGAAVHAKLDELDVRPEDDGTLFIERRFTAEGKSTARIGGSELEHVQLFLFYRRRRRQLGRNRAAPGRAEAHPQ